MGLKVGGANKALDGVFDAQVYVGLHTGNPSTSNELVVGSSPGYARKAVATTGWSKSSSGSTRRNRNTAAVSFSGAISGDWQDATHYAVYSALTGGTLLFSGSFSNNPDAPDSGDSVSIAALGISFGFTIDT